MRSPFSAVMRFLKATANHHLRGRNGDELRDVAEVYSRCHAVIHQMQMVVPFSKINVLQNCSTETFSVFTSYHPDIMVNV